MKVDFNSYQSNSSPNFGKLIVTDAAKELVKTQYRSLPISSTKEAYLDTFAKQVKLLNNSPVLAFLMKESAKLKLEIFDISADNFFKSRKLGTYKQTENTSDLGFMVLANARVKEQVDDSNAIKEVLKSNNIEIVDNVEKLAIVKEHNLNIGEKIVL